MEMLCSLASVTLWPSSTPKTSEVSTAAEVIEHPTDQSMRMPFCSSDSDTISEELDDDNQTSPAPSPEEPNRRSPSPSPSPARKFRSSLSSMQRAELLREARKLCQAYSLAPTEEALQGLSRASVILQQLLSAEPKEGQVPDTSKRHSGLCSVVRCMPSRSVRLVRTPTEEPYTATGAGVSTRSAAGCVAAGVDRVCCCCCCCW